MIGGIVGDIAGSFFENRDLPFRSYTFLTKEIFSHHAKPTDDSILLAATGAALMDDSDDFGKYYRKYAGFYPNAGYGPGFDNWLNRQEQQFQSFGNGAASRAGVIGYLNNEKDVLDLARRSALVTHQHEEAITGAEAMAWVVWAKRHGISNQEICEEVYTKWNYDVAEDSHYLEKIETNFDCSAVNTVPLALYIALVHAKCYQDSVRAAIYSGGDVDTVACMAGLITSQDYIVDFDWEQIAKQRVWRHAHRILPIIQNFSDNFSCDYEEPYDEEEYSLMIDD